MLLAVYRDTEGFTHEEVCLLHRVFGRFAEPVEGGREGEREIPNGSFYDALLYMFGPQSIKMAKEIAAKLLKEDADNIKSNFEKEVYGATDGNNKPKPKIGFQVGNAAAEEKTGLSFREFLTWARRLREAEVAQYKAQFREFDKSGDDRISYDELIACMTGLGYTPLRAPLTECLIQVTDATLEDVLLDFEQFFNLMIAFRQTDGFTIAEAKELTDTFMLFDDKKAGEIDVVDLMDILRYMGHRYTLQTCRRLVKEVDFNGNGSLDSKEFFRLMRLLREEELRDRREIYDHSIRVQEEYLLVVDLPDAFADLGMRLEDGVEMNTLLGPDVFEEAKTKGLDFESFVATVDRMRHDGLDTFRKNAGFTTKEVEVFLAAFNKYDENGNGTIEHDELANLILDLNLPMKTINDQKAFLGIIQKSRNVAKRVGLKEVEVLKDGCPEVTFPLFLHFFRTLERQEKEAEAIRNEEIAAYARFTDQETNEFRGVFENAVLSMTRTVEDIDQEDPTSAPSPTPPQPSSGGGALVGIGQKQGQQDLMLPFDGLKGLIKNLGISLKDPMTQILQAQVDAVSASGSDSGIDFMGFLSLMRWMLETDFGGVVKHGPYLQDQEKMREIRTAETAARIGSKGSI